MGSPLQSALEIRRNRNDDDLPGRSHAMDVVGVLCSVAFDRTTMRLDNQTPQLCLSVMSEPGSGTGSLSFRTSFPLSRIEKWVV